MAGRFTLPIDHQPGLRVPRGGSSCSNCAFYRARVGVHGSCASPDFQRFYGTALIPCPPDSYCSDWYEPDRPLPPCPSPTTIAAIRSRR